MNKQQTSDNQVALEFKNKTVLITGGASGIGLGLARKFREAGNTVIICGRRAEKLREAEIAVRGLRTKQVDLAEAADRVSFSQWLVREFPSFDVLVNNAGVQCRVDLTGRGQLPTQGAQVAAALRAQAVAVRGNAKGVQRVSDGILSSPGQSLHSVSQPVFGAAPVVSVGEGASADDWDSVRKEIQINLEAPIHLVQLLTPHLSRQSNPAIINVTSGLSFVPKADVPIYCATKAALHSLTLSLRYQLRDSAVRVIEIAPPAVDTDLGGVGLHKFGVPLDEFINAAWTGLTGGQQEITHGFSTASSRADRAGLQDLFMKLNP